MGTYTDDQKAHAVELYTEVGAGEAARRTGIPQQSISRWAKAAGATSTRNEKMRAANEAGALSIEAKRQKLAFDLFDDIEQLRAELFAPCVEKRAMTVSRGRHEGSEVEVVEIQLDRPTFSEQKAIITSVAIAVDKVQVLTGEATERIEVSGDVRTRAVEMADELARRRARKST